MCRFHMSSTQYFHILSDAKAEETSEQREQRLTRQREQYRERLVRTRAEETSEQSKGWQVHGNQQVRTHRASNTG